MSGRIYLKCLERSAEGYATVALQMSLRIDEGKVPGDFVNFTSDLSFAVLACDQ